MRMGIEEVTELAMEYLRKAGHTWRRVLKVIPNKENREWKVVLDVGVILVTPKTVTIDDESGKIIGFDCAL